MKKKIAILDQQVLLEIIIKIIKKDKKNLKLNYLQQIKIIKKLLKQVKIFNVKNIIITDKKSF